MWESSQQLRKNIVRSTSEKKKIQESMDWCSGRYEITEMLKTALNTIQSIKKTTKLRFALSITIVAKCDKNNKCGLTFFFVKVCGDNFLSSNLSSIY